MALPPLTISGELPEGIHLATINGCWSIDGVENRDGVGKGIVQINL